MIITTIRILIFNDEMHYKNHQPLRHAHPSISPCNTTAYPTFPGGQENTDRVHSIYTPKAQCNMLNIQTLVVSLKGLTFLGTICHAYAAVLRWTCESQKAGKHSCFPSNKPRHPSDPIDCFQTKATYLSEDSKSIASIVQKEGASFIKKNPLYQKNPFHKTEWTEGYWANWAN